MASLKMPVNYLVTHNIISSQCYAYESNKNAQTNATFSIKIRLVFLIYTCQHEMTPSINVKVL